MGSSNIWVTADPHFGHKNISQYCNRPFFSVEEMDEVLIENWNRWVKPNDKVYLLGDFCFPRGAVEKYRARLNGDIDLVLGNHDDPKKVAGHFTNIYRDFYLRHEGLRFFMSHYSHRTWVNSDYGSYHLYGHSHGGLPGVGRSMDVGVDAVAKLLGEGYMHAEDYRPLALEEVVTILGEAPLFSHHTGELVSE